MFYRPGAELSESALELVQCPWDWLLERDSPERKSQKPMSRDDIKQMEQNIVWTNDVYERMQKQFPPDECWMD